MKEKHLPLKFTLYAWKTILYQLQYVFVKKSMGKTICYYCKFLLKYY